MQQCKLILLERQLEARDRSGTPDEGQHLCNSSYAIKNAKTPYRLTKNYGYLNFESFWAWVGLKQILIITFYSYKVFS